MSKLELKQFHTPDEVRPFTGHGHVDLVQLTTGPVGLGTFEPGWKWCLLAQPARRAPSATRSTTSRLQAGLAFKPSRQT
jgi:hypothetical protein